MTTFYLVRHGKRVDRSEETLLSRIGEKEAQVTASFLEKLKIDTITASPLKRTQQTAQIFNKKLQLPIATDHRLEERMIFDASKGKTFGEFLGEWDCTMNDRNYRPLYGDSAIVAGKRMQSVLDELPEGKTHLIVSHGGIIGDLLRNLFSDDLLPFRTDPTTSLQWVQISECSITQVNREDGKYSLERVNDVSHLS